MIFSISIAPPQTHCVHDGTSEQFSHQPRVATFSILPGTTHVGWGSFWRTSVASLTPLLLSSVTLLDEGCFAETPLPSLVGLPPSLLYVADGAFDSCHLLPSLSHLPYATEAHPTAFGEGDSRCKLLLAKARELGFADIDGWVQDRRLTPARRRALLLCVAAARRQEGVRRSRSRVCPVLAGIASLPDELIRELTCVAFGDHV
ncbi:hypothetical protein TeGR_g14976 [Tetraparma gracilis]|uniref:DDE Tnp4 domain-containing protein n=1 Tax=Tetraparma gracilis TaxID=2962635 RepID=A0ABQ6N0I8_9STRA|nr:hypothetical protein TeGR_g14976 [Tetraparma gracilis]